jgi:hypothetical protein
MEGGVEATIFTGSVGGTVKIETQSANYRNTRFDMGITRDSLPIKNNKVPRWLNFGSALFCTHKKNATSAICGDPHALPLRQDGYELIS